jgi:hypothetical protein
MHKIDDEIMRIYWPRKANVTLKTHEMGLQMNPKLKRTCAKEPTAVQ